MGHDDSGYPPEHFIKRTDYNFDPHLYGKLTEEEKEKFILGLNNF